MHNDAENIWQKKNAHFAKRRQPNLRDALELAAVAVALGLRLVEVRLEVLTSAGNDSNAASFLHWICVANILDSFLSVVLICTYFSACSCFQLSSVGCIFGFYSSQSFFSNPILRACPLSRHVRTSDGRRPKMRN